MSLKLLTCRAALVAAALALAACADASGGADFDTGIGGADGAAPGGDDGNADGGQGTGGPGGGGDGEPPPEMEEEGDFRVPRASGRFVYSASEATDSVAVIDSTTLAIEVVGVGRGPTVVAPLSDNGEVAVLDQGSDDVALLTTADDGSTTVHVLPTSPGANNLAVSPDDNLVFVYHDVDGPEQLGAGSDQELSVIDRAADTVHNMTVGAHPRDVVFDSTGSIGYVVTDDGVNVVPAADLAMIGLPDLIPVTDDPAIDPANLEIHVAGDQQIALARVAGEEQIFVTNLADGDRTTVNLPAAATDLDIAADGSFAIVMMPSVDGSRFIEFELPLTGSLVNVEVPTEYVGLAHLAPDGATMLLYTTVNPFADAYVGGGAQPGALGAWDEPSYGELPTGTTTGEVPTGTTSDGSSSDGLPGDEGTTDDGGDDGGVSPDDDPRQRITIARRGGGDWSDRITLFVDFPIVSVGMAPDGQTAVLVHQMAPEGGAVPWSYTLLDLSKEFPVKKLQTVEAEPGSIVFTPQGDRAVVLLRDDSAGVQRVDQVDLRSFIVDGLTLGSPPEGAGYVDATEKIFVSQEHPTGRITFIDREGGVETVTGFRLNDAVKD